RRPPISSLFPYTTLFRSQLISIAIALLLACTGLLSSNTDDYLYFGGYTIFAVAVGALVILLVKSPPEPLNRLLRVPALVWIGRRSEEHTSELQSLTNLVC